MTQIKDKQRRTPGRLRDIGCTGGQHGGSKTRAYTAWRKFVLRCLDPRHPDYNSYGGKGISVCDRWKDFKRFFADMGEAPIKKSIDRIDNNGNYEPGNCRWATATTQAQNRSSTLLLTINSKTKPVIVWAREHGLAYNTIFARIKYGDPNTSLFRPSRQKTKRGTLKNGRQ